VNGPFKTPFAVSGEKQWNRDWTVELAINVNGINEGQDFDPGPAPEDFTYFSLDAMAKWYFGRQIFRRGYDKIDFYLNGGLGFFTIDQSNVSVNFGGGVLFWLNEARQSIPSAFDCSVLVSLPLIMPTVALTTTTTNGGSMRSGGLNKNSLS
jgi:hypothetical protein